MGKAIDALLAQQEDDDKKKRQQSGQQDSGVSYVNNNQSQKTAGSNIDQLLQSVQQPGYKPPTDAYNNQQPVTKPQQRQQQQQQQPSGNIFGKIAQGFNNTMSEVTNFITPKITTLPKPDLTNPITQQKPGQSPVNNDELKKKLQLDFSQQSSITSAQLNGKPQSPANTNKPGESTLSAYNPTPWDKVTEFFNNLTGNDAVSQKARAANAYALDENAYKNIVNKVAKQENKAPQQVDQEFQKSATVLGFGASKYDMAAEKSGVALPKLSTLDQQGTIFKDAPVQEIYKQIGVSDAPTDADFTNMLMTAAVGFGLAEAPLQTLKAVGMFSAVNEVKSNFIAALTGQQLGVGQNHSLSDFTPGANSAVKTTLDVLDFLGTGAVTGGILKASPAVFEKLTKDVVVKYGIPETMQFSPDQVQRVVKGQEVGKVKDDLAKAGLTSEQWREAATKGLQIQMPTEKVAMMVDKPYWQQIKGLFGVGPSDPQTTISLTDKSLTNIAGYLPDQAGQVQPDLPGATMPDVIKQEFNKPEETPSAIDTLQQQQEQPKPEPVPEPKTLGDFKALAEKNNVTVPDEFKSDAEKKAISYVLTHAEELTQKYLETYPDEINGDKAKDLLKDIGYNRTNVTDYDVAGGILSKMAYDAQLEAHVNDANKTILFLQGGPGSGKSSVSARVSSNQDYAFTFDSNLANYNTAVKMIEQAKEAGYKVDVKLTDRPIETAYKEGVLKRYKEGEARTVPIKTHVNNHILARETNVKLYDHYLDDPEVDIAAWANHGATPEGVRPMSIDEVKKLAYDYKEKQEEITSKLHEHTANEHNNGNLTAEQYTALSGGEKPAVRGNTETNSEGNKPEAKTTATTEVTPKAAQQPVSDTLNKLKAELADLEQRKKIFSKDDGLGIDNSANYDRLIEDTKKKIAEVEKGGIIEPNEQSSQNTEPRSNTAEVSTPVHMGSGEPSNPHNYDTPNDKEAVQQQPQSNRDVLSGTRERPETRTEQSKRVDAVTGKSPKGRYQINKQVETIIDSKSPDELFDPKSYTDTEKDLMRKYSGYGGINKEDVGHGALDEFFTPKKVVDFTWQEVMKAIGESALTVERIIEPSVGVGRFMDGAPFPEKKFAGFEINKYSAVVAKVLHPESNIQLKNFQELFIKNRTPVKSIEPSVDLIIGNPPYGEYTGLYKGMGEGLQYKTFEEYFIGRGLDLVKEGGHVAYIVQSSFLRGGGTHGKVEISGKGKLVAAYRFPNGIFKESGTDIGTDLVIFRKDAASVNGELMSNDGYFAEHPERVLGNEVEKTGRFGLEKYVEGDMSNIKIEDNPISSVESRPVEVKEPQESKPVKETIKKVNNEKAAREATKKLKNLYITHTAKGETQQVGDITNTAPVEFEGYKNVTTDGSLNPDFVKSLTPLDRQTYFSYQGGKWYPDKAYIDSKNLYQLLDQLEKEKDEITLAQYQKQSKWIRDNLPAWTFTKDIKIDVRHKMWEELQVDDPRRSGQKESVKSLFISALWSYPNTMMEGLDRGDVVGYVTDSNVKAITDEQKKFITNNRARIANKLLLHFLKSIDEVSPGAKEQIETYYNRSFNAYKVLSHEYIPILGKVNAIFNGDEFELNPAQRNAIGFLLSRGKGIAALDVGVGKTITGIIAMNESFERGWAKRGVIIAPNPSIGKQWIDEIKNALPSMQMYDMTNTGNLDKLRGVQMLEKSVLIITGDGMEKIGLTQQSYMNILPEIEEAASSLELSATARAKAQESEKAQQVIGQSMQGTFEDLTWESLGVDMMILDEAHNYNHIIGSVPSGAKEGQRKINPYSGLTMNPSKRGVKAYVLGKHILKNNNQRNVYLMTATPFTNNPLEHYSMMSFVADKEMKERGVYNVREYIQSFMQMENQSVVNPAGQIVDKQVVTNFTNFDAYQQLLSSAMIKIDGEDAGVKRPTREDKNVFLKTSEPQFHLAAKLSQAYTDLTDAIKKSSDKEAKKVLSGKRLRVMTSLVANGFSPYASKFYDGKAPTAKEFVENTPKLKVAAEMIKANLEKTKGEANSIVYIPFVGNSDLGINFHNLFKEYLVKEKGIKADQIATITGDTTRVQRIAIQDAFNEGKVKVLTGTYAIAEGLNLQTRTTDIFVTAPFWNYTQFRQMAGRAWRQGNMWKKVRVHLLMAEGTGDTFVSQKIMEKERRDKIISQAVKEGKAIKESGGDELDFEEVLGSLLSDPVQRVSMQKLEEEKQLRAEIAGIDGQLEYAKRLTDPYAREALERNANNAQITYDRYKSDMQAAQTTLQTISDKSSDQAQYLQRTIDNNKEYMKKMSQQVKLNKERLAKIKETVEKNGITPEYTEYLSKQLTEKKQTLQDLTAKFDAKMKEAQAEKAKMTWQPTDYKAILDKHLEENKTFFVKDKPAGNGAPGGNADVGGYADMKEVAQQTEFKAMQFPEILRMIQEVSGNEVKLKDFKKALGRTYVSKEEEEAYVALNRSLFDSHMPLEIKAKTAAHELGHLADAMPDYDLARGNLLGHILTLNNFIKQKYEDLSNKTIRNELKTLTQIWKPFDETENKSFTKYRYSPKELYADAVSVLFNQPDLLKETAPEFWKGFFAELDKKPEVKKSFFKMWDLLTKGQEEVLSDRRKVINESFKDAEEKWNVLRHEEKIKKENFFFQVKYDHIDQNQRLIDLYRKALKEGKIVPDSLNPELLLDEKTMIGSRYKVLLEKEINPIVQEFIRRDIPQEALAEMLLYERIISAPERADIANPFGLDRETAQDTLNKLEKDLGRENTEFVRQSAVAVRTAFKALLDEGYNLGMYSDELYQEMKNNPAYATFAVIDYLDTHISGSIISGKGTLKGVGNTFTATVMKMMGTIKAIEDQRVTLGVREFLNTYNPDSIKKPEYKFDANVNAQVPQESTDPNWELVKFYNKGKIDGFLVDPYIAKSLKYQSHETTAIVLKILKVLNGKWFRPIYTVINPGFETFNLARDFFRSSMNMPGGDLFINMYRVFTGHIKALPHAIAKGFDKEDPLVMEMYEKRLFTIRYSDYSLGKTDEDKQLEAILAATKVFDSQKSARTFLTPFINTLQFIENVGDTIMALPKIAGYTYLQGSMPEKELGFFIRNYLGHSNMQTKGAQNWWTNDVFLFSRSIMQAARRDFYLGFQNPKTRAGWQFRFAQLAILPKLLMFMAAAGYFGNEMKKQMDNVSEYDKTNYLVMPLGLDENGKTKYMRIPQTELNRMIGGLFWKILNIGNKDNTSPWYDSVSQLLSFTGGQLPSLSPVIQTTEATREFLAGQNPYDFYRGRNIIPTTEFNAGGMNKLKPFAYWMIQNMGGAMVLGTSVTENTGDHSSWLQKMVEAPVLSNLVGRWLKVSNYGQTEQNRALNTEATTQSAQQSLKEKDALQTAIQQFKQSDGTNNSARNIARQMIISVYGGAPNKDQETQAKNLLNKYRLDLLKGQVDPNASAFIDETSNASRLMLLQRMKDSMSSSDYSDLKQELVQYKIVSNSFVKKAIQAGL